MVTLEFPPVNSTGGYRYIKLLRHFKKFGINPIVIAPTVESSLRLWENRKIDSELEEAIPADIIVHRVPLPKRAYIVRKTMTFSEKVDFYIKYKDNASSLWKPALFKFLEELLKSQQIDVLYISPPPFSLCRLASEVSLKFNLPLFLDLRDDWLFNKGNPFPTFFHFLAAKRDVKSALNQAKGINVVTSPLVTMTRTVFPNIPVSKFSVITNGFDQDEINLMPFLNKVWEPDQKYKIGYSGEFYYHPETLKNARSKWWSRKGIRKLNYLSNLSREDWSYRSPLYFLRAMKMLFELRPSVKSNFFFEHIGSTPDWLFAMIKDFNLQENFVAHGFVSKKANIEIQKTWNAILVTSEKVLEGQHYCISSKIFDAILIQKPIVGFVTSGASREVLERSGCSILCEPDNLHDCVSNMEALLFEEQKFYPNLDYLQKFLPESITYSLAQRFINIGKPN